MRSGFKKAFRISKHSRFQFFKLNAVKMLKVLPFGAGPAQEVENLTCFKVEWFAGHLRMETLTSHSLAVLLKHLELHQSSI